MRAHQRVGVYRRVRTHERPRLRDLARGRVGGFRVAKLKAGGWNGRERITWPERDHVSMEGPCGKQEEPLSVPGPTDQRRSHATVFRAPGAAFGAHSHSLPTRRRIYVDVRPRPRGNPLTVGRNGVETDHSIRNDLMQACAVRLDPLQVHVSFLPADEKDIAIRSKESADR